MVDEAQNDDAELAEDAEPAETAETAETTDSEEAVEPGEHVEDHAEDEPEEHAEEEHAEDVEPATAPLSEAATPRQSPRRPPRSLLSPEASCRPVRCHAARYFGHHVVAQCDLYQIYPRSFSDANGDGVGDLVGVISRLWIPGTAGCGRHLAEPDHVLPMADHGYDVSDPRDIDPVFGSIALFDNLIAEAHARDIRVTMDLVPNHTSDQHEWFRAALAAGPGSPERARYIFRDGRGEGGDEPPNNWLSVFGGPAWHRHRGRRLAGPVVHAHLRPEQPDLNWENPEVSTTWRRPCGSGSTAASTVSGSTWRTAWPSPRICPTWIWMPTRLLENNDDDPRFNNYAVHAIHRKIRRVMDDYPGAANVGEIWVEDNERFAEYLRPDELHLGFNFGSPGRIHSGVGRAAIENSLEAVLSVNGVPTWTLSNHDVDREVSRYTQTPQIPTGRSGGGARRRHSGRPGDGAGRVGVAGIDLHL